MAAVAQSRIQDDVHPLLRHPKPIKRDSAKAQRMLGLIANDEEKLKALQREKSVTTRWLERPMYEHLEMSDLESEREETAHEHKVDSVHEERIGEDDSELLERWTRPDRPASYSSEASIRSEAKPTTFVRRRSGPISCPRPISYNAQHLLSPEWTASPTTMSPNVQRPRPISMQPNSPNTGRGSFSSNSSLDSIPRLVRPQAWAAPQIQDSSNARSERPVSFQPQSFASLRSPMANEPRPRPTSFATYPHQRNRSHSKIASSRGLRNNSYPNFSRPIADTAPRAVPGEQMENDRLYQRFSDDEVGPPSPHSPVRTALSGYESIEERIVPGKKPKKRWSTIPHTFKKLAGRRLSAASQELPKFEVKFDDLRQMNLTEQNLHWHENDISQAPATLKTHLSGIDLIPTPTYSPFDMEHPLFESELPLPFAPWADGPPSPASNKRGSSSTSSLSPTRKVAPSQLSVDNAACGRPASLHSHRSSIVELPPTSTASQRRPAIDVPLSPRTTPSRRNTPTLERTCILCKTTKSSFEFIKDRVTSNCWHETATCLPCLQSWIQTCLKDQGWSQCTCPECGEHMTPADVGALASDVAF